jgi:hypothetical protein
MTRRSPKTATRRVEAEDGGRPCGPQTDGQVERARSYDSGTIIGPAGARQDDGAGEPGLSGSP